MVECERKRDYGMTGERWIEFGMYSGLSRMWEVSNSGEDVDLMGLELGRGKMLVKGLGEDQGWCVWAGMQGMCMLC